MIPLVTPLYWIRYEGEYPPASIRDGSSNQRTLPYQLSYRDVTGEDSRKLFPYAQPLCYTFDSMNIARH